MRPQVVWDVDPIALEIRSYHRDSPNEPRIFKPGDEAGAEPAVSGWRIPVNEVFELWRLDALAAAIPTEGKSSEERGKSAGLLLAPDFVEALLGEVW